MAVVLFNFGRSLRNIHLCRFSGNVFSSSSLLYTTLVTFEASRFWGSLLSEVGYFRGAMYILSNLWSMLMLRHLRKDKRNSAASFLRICRTITLHFVLWLKLFSSKHYGEQLAWMNLSCRKTGNDSWSCCSVIWQNAPIRSQNYSDRLETVC